MTAHKSSWLPFVLAGLSFLATLYMASTHTDRENAGRISALEAHQMEASGRFDRIEHKIDQIAEHLNWALGKEPRQ